MKRKHKPLGSRARLVGLLMVLLPALARAQDEPGTGVWENYDFVPGDSVLFFEDFSGAYVGDFPADRLSFLNGRMDVVERNGSRMLRTESRGEFEVVLPQALPERFTVEFDVEATDARHKLYLWTEETRHFNPSSAEAIFAVVTPAGSGLSVGKYAKGPVAVQETGDLTHGRPATIRLSAEGPYLKMYVNERRVANVPRGPFVRSNALRFRLEVYPHDDEALYLDNLRVAEGGRERLYDRLMADGFFATQALYFDVGEATLRPESTPFLNDVARLLEEHPDVRLLIEGHTDDTGTDALNDPLSLARAGAVRAFLVERRGVAAARLAAAGYGSKQPVASNATPEGRAQNRRVVFRRVTSE